MQDFDIVINGGGMVGSASACLLADLGLSVAVIEAQRPLSFSRDQAMDSRVSAISAGSVALLKQCGIWPLVLDMRACQYQTLQTWQRGSHKLRFCASELELPELGYIVENRLIQLALWQKLEQHPKVTLFCPASLKTYRYGEDGVFCELNSGDVISAQLALACDGAHSQLRSLAGIGISGWDYRQHCMLINISTDFPQQAETWQEFCPTGPRSFLPLAGNNASLVWYHDADEIARLSRLEYLELKQSVVEYFPPLPGDFRISNTASFALTRRHAQAYYKNGVVLLGDAAHTINPLAGQGVNLGFKDVAALVRLMGTAIDNEQPWSSIELQKRYQLERMADNHLMQSSMDLFYLGFSNDSRPLSFLRNQALKLADKSGGLKKAALRYAMGLPVF